MKSISFLSNILFNGSTSVFKYLSLPGISFLTSVINLIIIGLITNRLGIVQMGFYTFALTLSSICLNVSSLPFERSLISRLSASKTLLTFELLDNIFARLFFLLISQLPLQYILFMKSGNLYLMLFLLFESLKGVVPQYFFDFYRLIRLEVLSRFFDKFITLSLMLIYFQLGFDNELVGFIPLMTGSLFSLCIIVSKCFIDLRHYYSSSLSKVNYIKSLLLEIRLALRLAVIEISKLLEGSFLKLLLGLFDQFAILGLFGLATQITNVIMLPLSFQIRAKNKSFCTTFLTKSNSTTASHLFSSIFKVCMIYNLIFIPLLVLLFLISPFIFGNLELPFSHDVFLISACLFPYVVYSRLNFLLSNVLLSLRSIQYLNTIYILTGLAAQLFFTYWFLLILLIHLCWHLS